MILAHLTSLLVQAYHIASGLDLSRGTGPKMLVENLTVAPPLCDERHVHGGRIADPAAALLDIYLTLLLSWTYA